MIVFSALALAVMAGCSVAGETDSDPGQPGSSAGELLPDPTGSGNTDGSNGSGDDSASTDSPAKNSAPVNDAPGDDGTGDDGGPMGGDTASGSAGTSGSDTDTTSPSTGSRLALDVLSRIVVANEFPSGYSRELFRHWIDADSDGCNTRQEVLIAESRSPAQVDRFGCAVVEGDWYSPFDAMEHTDPSDLDIDHLVPLKEAWDSGAHAWSSSRRESFANDLSDPRSLVAVTAGVNRSKGDRDPSQWLPPRSGYVCTYVADWIAVKYQWELTMDQSEWGRLRNLLNGQCAGTTVAAWGRGGAADTSTNTSSRDPAPTSVAPSTTTTTLVKSQTTVALESDDSGVLPTITPGAYCAPIGALGTYKEVTYLCATTNADGEPYSNGRARWRRR